MTTQAELFEVRQVGNVTLFETSRLVSGIKNNPELTSPGLPPPAPADSFSGQTANILHYLQSGHSITPLEALDKFGCFRLGARCWDLRKAGYAIKSEMVEINGKHVARYSL